MCIRPLISRLRSIFIKRIMIGWSRRGASRESRVGRERRRMWNPKRPNQSIATAQDGRLARLTDGEPVVSVADAKQWLRVDSDLENGAIDRAILAVQNQLVPPDGWLGRALTTATFRMTLDQLADRIFLPAAPLQSVTAFEYRSTGGATKVIDEALYRVIDTEPAEIVRARNASWPSDVDFSQPDAVSIEFTAGYGGAADVPDAIQQWVLYQVSQIHDIRQPIVVGTIVSETPYVRHMLEGYRIRT